LWIVGFLLLFFTFASLIALWIIRGYVNWGNGDPFTHVMLTNYIISNHHISPADFYPITHILAAEISYVSNIQVTEIYGYIPLIFNILFLTFVYAFVKTILSSKGAIILAIVLAIVVILGFSNSNTYFTPNSLADLYLPFALYLFAKSSSSRTPIWKMLFIVVIFMYPLFHPVTSFALLLIMSTATIANIFFAKWGKKDLNSIRGIFNFNLFIILFLLVWSVVWFSTTVVWAPTINNLRNYLSGQGTNQLSTLNQLVQKAQQFQYSPLLEFCKVYGGLIVIALIAFTTLIMLLRSSLAERDGKNLISLVGPLAMIFFFIIVFYLLNIGFSPLRLVAYIAMILAIMAAFGLNKLLEWLCDKPKMVRCSVLIISLICLIVVVTFTASTIELYPSKYILQQNDQVTRSDLQGMDWFFNYRNQNYQLSTLRMVPSRFADYILSPQEISEQMNLTPVTLEENEDTNIPWHFGYDEFDEFGYWFNTKTYLLIDQADRSFYGDIFPAIQNQRFTPADFERLDADPSLEQVYSNGGLNIYQITPLK
jgi:hypothetical protein